MIEHYDTLGDVLKRHFTRETGLYITSEEHSFAESNEKDWYEYFDGDVGEFLDRDDMQELQDLNPSLDCDVRFNGDDCLIYVTIYDDTVLLQDNEE